MKSYFVKKPDNAVYGPVDLDELRDWAAEGRVAPGDMVSIDRASWSPAPSVPELCMRWVVELERGKKVGPAHIMAIKDLIQEGVLHEDCRVRDVENGDDVSYQEACAREEQGSAMETKSGEPEREPLSKADSIQPSPIPFPVDLPAAPEEADSVCDDTQIDLLAEPPDEKESESQMATSSECSAPVSKVSEVDLQTKEDATREQETSDALEGLTEAAEEARNVAAECVRERDAIVSEYARKEIQLQKVVFEAIAERDDLKEERDQLLHERDELKKERGDLRKERDQLKEEGARLHERIEEMARWKNETDSISASSVTESAEKPSVSVEIQKKVVQVAASRSTKRAMHAARDAAKSKLSKRISRAQSKSSAPRIRRGPTSRF